MYNNPSRPVPHRVDQHRGKLSAFNMKVKFVPRDKNPYNYGFRHPDKFKDNITKEQREKIGVETEEEDMEVWLSRVIKGSPVHHHHGLVARRHR